MLVSELLLPEINIDAGAYCGVAGTVSGGGNRIACM
jgi:hypothetical protein